MLRENLHKEDRLTLGHKKLIEDPLSSKLPVSRTQTTIVDHGLPISMIYRMSRNLLDFIILTSREFYGYHRGDFLSLNLGNNMTISSALGLF